MKITKDVSDHYRDLYGSEPTMTERTELTNKDLGMRFNTGKIRYDLIPRMWTKVLAEILTRGAVKYAPHNWEKGLSWAETTASLYRHLNAFLGGERYDPESGSHHLGHVAWNALALMYFDVKSIGKKDFHKEINEDQFPTTVDTEIFVGFEKRKKEGP